LNSSRIYAVCFQPKQAAFFVAENFFEKFFGKTAILGVHFIPLCPNE